MEKGKIKRGRERAEEGKEKGREGKEERGERAEKKKGEKSHCCFHDSSSFLTFKGSSLPICAG